MKVIDTTVRGTAMKLVGYTRSLELCSRMNYEVENLDFIDKMLPGEVLYDLGACEGRFSIYACLKGIFCYSFEPEENNYNAFLENIALNKLDSANIRPFKLGVGEKNSDAVLEIGQPWAGGHQKVVKQAETRDDLAFDFKEEQIVKIVSLDEQIQAEALVFPDYLKIDIDGSEMAFIRGAQQTLSNPKLKMIIFELEVNDKNFTAIIDNLLSHGLREESRFAVPNEPSLFNIIFKRRQ